MGLPRLPLTRSQGNPGQSPSTAGARAALRLLMRLMRMRLIRPGPPGPSTAASTVPADSPRSYATAGTGGIAKRWHG